MATVLGARGWECGETMLNTVDHQGASVSAVAPKTGGYCLRLFAFPSAHARWAIDGTPANPSVSVWVDASDSYDVENGIRIQFLLGTGEYIEILWNEVTHTLDAYVDGGLVEAGTIEISVNDWFHVQFSLVIDDAGSIQVKIDGHLSIDYSGDTQPGAATGATYVYVNGLNQIEFFIDDLVWGTAGYLGDLRCLDIRPTADTGQDDWTPSAGDNYSTIDETPPSDADYNETNTDAQADELDMGDFDGVTYDPRATVAWVRAKMLAATGDSIKVGVDSAATDSVTEHALSTDEEYYFHTNDDNPADSGAWEDADIDALKLRYESVIA